MPLMKLMFLIGACLVSISSYAADWGYENDNGPDNWGKNYPLCANGKEQSPIDIQSSIQPSQLPQINFQYTEHPVLIKYDGYDIDLTFDKEQFIDIDNKRYALVNIHFHTPSEHTIDGQNSSIGIHLVHQNTIGELLVIGVFVKEGAENTALNTIWQNLLVAKSQQKVVGLSLNPLDILPKDRSYFHYMGSLTTPPCSESVKWYVLKESVEFSAAQILNYRDIFHENARPVQELNDRIVKASK